MTNLQSSFQLRDVCFPNRVLVSPMCQYSASDGFVNDWHLQHLSRFGIGGFGGIFVEATAISAEGRITNGCLGLWSDEHVAGLKRLVSLIEASGSVPGIQLGHAGRKGAMQRPWEGNGPITEKEIANCDRVWPVVGPTTEPVAEGWLAPTALDRDGMDEITNRFVEATKRARECGFQMLEVHAAHGYLLHTFLSPYSNNRNDEYGGDLESRCKFPLQVISAVRKAWPEKFPLFVRISAIDGFEGGWSLDDSVYFAGELKTLGVDAVDCSSGGISGPATAARIPRVTGFQLPFAERIRREAQIPTVGVGLIRTAAQANDAIKNEQADLIAIGREALFDPNWALHALGELNSESKEKFSNWPKQVGWWLEQRELSIANSKGSTTGSSNGTRSK